MTIWQPAWRGPWRSKVLRRLGIPAVLLLPLLPIAPNITNPDHIESSSRTLRRVGPKLPFLPRHYFMLLSLVITYCHCNYRIPQSRQWCSFCLLSVESNEVSSSNKSDKNHVTTLIVAKSNRCINCIWHCCWCGCLLCWSTYCRVLFNRSAMYDAAIHSS